MTQQTNGSYQLPPGKKKELIEAVTLSLYEVKAYDLPAVCVGFGLSSGTESEAHASKRGYVRSRLIELSDQQILNVATSVDHEYPRFELTELLRKLNEFGNGPEVSEITRRALLDVLNSVPLFGELRPVEELNKFWPLASMPGTWTFKSIEDSIWQHFVRNPDWDNSELLEHLGIFTCSRTLLFKLLEAVVHPNVRRGDEQKNLIAQLEVHLKNDGYHFVQTSTISGYPVFSVVSIRGGVGGAPKNLIFAADGFKPEIVLSDAINNDIKIVKNAEYCLVYDRPIGNNGLTKGEMIEWWAVREAITDEALARRSLYERLKRSLASDGERNLFDVYYKATKALGDKVPALIPQVYLHYDPYTIKQLGGVTRLPRQRMDFLILFSSAVRVVLEVDGSQHFAEDGKPSLSKYAGMMAADRELRLAGYEVFRFGANELVGSGAETLISNFVRALLKKHGL
jgi:very-short-patch-repair endonuclease